MGLFSKVSVCENCGKEYQAGLFGGKLCNDCKERIIKKREKVKGYIEYSEKWGLKLVNANKEDQLDAVAAHRDAILEKYRADFDERYLEELLKAANSNKEAKVEQIHALIDNASISVLDSTLGAAYTSNFFVPTGYERVIVDAEDVFAVAYTSDWQNDSSEGENILCAIFTNDPYIPAIPINFFGEYKYSNIKDFFKNWDKSLGARKGVETFFTLTCPNLTYPVQDVKELTKLIKNEDTVRANIEKRDMLDWLSDAKLNNRIFETRDMKSYLPRSSADMMVRNGYAQLPEVHNIMFDMD